MLAKRPAGSRLRSLAWSQVPVALRERAQFSAAIESLRFLGAVQEKLVLRLGLEREAAGEGEMAFVDRSSFIADLRKIAQEEGLATGDGGLTDPGSRQRLGLIYDTQTRQAAEHARWAVASDPDLIDEYPAQELVREESRKVPREWMARWAAAGGRFYDGGRMIARKSDRVWWNLGPFGVPWPPYDWNSGMGVIDIDRDEAESLGVIGRGEAAESPEAAFNEHLEASAEGLSDEMQGWLRESFGERVEISGGRVRWRESGA